MSRIPTSSRTPSKAGPALRPPSTPNSRRASPTPTTRQRPPPPASPSPAVSIKEAIAQKRAQAKKAAKSQPADASAADPPTDALTDPLGRLSVRDTIERARSTGALNLATRSLPCLPSALFTIHLNITPDKLTSVPDEPVLPSSDHSSPKKSVSKTSWFEAQDLTVLKAGNNEIQEIQHEISLFGSLKTVDLHKNKLITLPDSFADLTALTVLDLSSNALTSLPDMIWALPELTTLNLSHNKLTSLPFNQPFNDAGRSSQHQSSGGFFTPALTRSTSPLPRLVILDASNNSIAASAIHDNVPVSLTKVDLSGNPLGSSQRLLQALASLKRLKELRFAQAQIGDESFQSTLFSGIPFPVLRLFDLSETQTNQQAVQAALRAMTQTFDFSFVTDEPPLGVTRLLIGKRIIKEAWEIDLERREAARFAQTVTVSDETPSPRESKVSDLSHSTVPSPPAPVATRTEPPPSNRNKELLKEAWEIEADQGLLTAGGRRRARAAAYEADGGETSMSPAPKVGQPGLSSLQYWSANTQTLTLPPSIPPARIGHNRAFSVASPSASSTRDEDLSVPTPTLPLSAITTQPFANTLKVLILANRRADRSFALPTIPISSSGYLPSLEELDLEGCNLGDTVSIFSTSTSESASQHRSTEPLIPTIVGLFPSLLTLNLSYNGLTELSFSHDVLSNLILASTQRRGLRHLRLRGNKISAVDGFQGLAEKFKGNREVPCWRLEELDLRDNNIGRLNPELGLLPLDVFLVDGNTFRVPQRRVWEREGTKGLLSWLRGRVE